MKENVKGWLSKTSSSFVASFLSGFLLLLIGTFFIHKGTSRDVTEKTAEPLRSVLEGVHTVSSDILGVRTAEVTPTNSLQNFELADELQSSSVGDNATEGADTHYVAAKADSEESR